MSSPSEVRSYAAEADHFRFFNEFVRWEKAAGGPDPHMQIPGYIAQGTTWRERLWMGMCYAAVYNAPTAELLWHEWPLARIRRSADHELTDWVAENWSGLAFRRERRPVRTRAKLPRFLLDCAAWCATAEFRWWLQTTTGNEASRYEAAWRDVTTIPYMGRYITIKFLEYARRFLNAPIALSDLRPRGGWSPREGLSLFYPQHADELMGDDRAEHLSLANALGASLLATLDPDLNASWFDVQVMLCQYKQSYVGQRQYPGRSLDSENEYFRKIEPHWSHGGWSKFYETRRRHFPHECLGELQGWSGVREELGSFLRQTGATWSDFQYDYLQTTDLRNPKTRENVHRHPRPPVSVSGIRPSSEPTGAAGSA